MRPLIPRLSRAASYLRPFFFVATEGVYGQKPDLTREGSFVSSLPSASSSACADHFLLPGGSIPVTLSFADALGVNVLLLPMGRGDDGAHSVRSSSPLSSNSTMNPADSSYLFLCLQINEKLDLSNYIKGTQLLGSYLHEVAALSE